MTGKQIGICIGGCIGVVLLAIGVGALATVLPMVAWLMFGGVLFLAVELFFARTYSKDGACRGNRDNRALAPTNQLH